MPDIDSPTAQVRSGMPLETSTFEYFEFVIYNQVGLVFKEKVTAIASGNTTGPFSILPGHTNFISMITDPIDAHLPNGEVRNFEVGLGVLRIFNNQAEAFVGLHINKQTEALAQRLQQPVAPMVPEKN